MGLISPGGENILDFLQLRQVLSTYDGDRRDPLWWPQERPVKIQDSTGEGETSREAPEQLAWGLAIVESTRAGPCGPRRKSRAPAATRENPGGTPLQADEAHFR